LFAAVKKNKTGGGRSIAVEVRIPPLSPLTMDILSPGDLFDELDAATELPLLQAGGVEGSSQDAEDVVTLKIPHHVVAFPRPDMTSLHHQLEIHLLPRFFVDATITEED
jgi:hypothetical protein